MAVLHYTLSVKLQYFYDQFRHRMADGARRPAAPREGNEHQSEAAYGFLRLQGLKPPVLSGGQCEDGFRRSAAHQAVGKVLNLVGNGVEVNLRRFIILSQTMRLLASKPPIFSRLTFGASCSIVQY